MSEDSWERLEERRLETESEKDTALPVRMLRCLFPLLLFLGYLGYQVVVQMWRRLVTGEFDKISVTLG